MPSANNEEQFKFLISCIRHANNSKVDFAEVAKECGIVTKGAANTISLCARAKRYERMMKAHGIAPNGGAVRGAPSPSGPKRDGSATSSKKRKFDKGSVDASGRTADDDEGVTGVKEEVGAGDFAVKLEQDTVSNPGSNCLLPGFGVEVVDSASSDGFELVEGVSSYLGGSPVAAYSRTELDHQESLDQAIDNASLESPKADGRDAASHRTDDAILISE
ncbi:MAG: hypothetical protein M1832_001265 [Thelocarpon impressellum]|nr:MAG: hypothetical protein M1832_001265 [Thelocarpon impressellum]